MQDGYRWNIAQCSDVVRMEVRKENEIDAGSVDLLLRRQGERQDVAVSLCRDRTQVDQWPAVTGIEQNRSEAWMMNARHQCGQCEPGSKARLIDKPGTIAAIADGVERDINRHAQYRMAIPFRDTPAAVPSNRAVCPRCRRPRRTARSNAIGMEALTWLPVSLSISMNGIGLPRRSASCLRRNARPTALA